MGGLVVCPSAGVVEIEEMVTLWRHRLSELEVGPVSVTLTPACYQRRPGQESVEFAMLRNGFRYGEPSLLMAAPVRQAEDFPEADLAPNARRHMRSAVKRGCTAVLENDLDGFWPILSETMARHQAVPTHTREELQWLFEHLPGSFRLLLASDGQRKIAGLLLMDVTGEATEAFYICSRDDASALRPVNLLNTHLLRWARDRGLAWIDYGPSTFALELHPTLIHFKEEHAGRGILRRTMVADGR